VSEKRVFFFKRLKEIAGMKQGKKGRRLHGVCMYTLIPWPNSTLIILFSEMLTFSKIIFSKSKNIYGERK
jgi:hypothetical protein